VALKKKLSQVETLEWNYRLARVYDESRNITKAVTFYKKTLSTSNPSKEYYPARAALQLAYIYENLNKKTMASTYFKKVLSIRDHEYKTSLDHKAKSGLLRIQGK
jgi:tetratricopeptide (TPR) repeat protein